MWFYLYSEAFSLSLLSSEAQLLRGHGQCHCGHYPEWGSETDFRINLHWSFLLWLLQTQITGWDWTSFLFHLILWLDWCQVRHTQIRFLGFFYGMAIFPTVIMTLLFCQMDEKCRGSNDNGKRQGRISDSPELLIGLLCLFDSLGTFPW